MTGGAGPLPAQRFVRDMVGGMIASKSVRLTKIGETLGEAVQPDSTERRLSRNLGAARVDYGALHANYLRRATTRLIGDVTIAVDLSDVIKPYARKMEGLATVRDGSRSTKDNAVLGNGYQALGVHGLTRDGDQAVHVPLHFEVFSLSMDVLLSERIVLRQAMATIAPFVPADALWVFDRGYDASKDFELFQESGVQWLVRFKGNRHIEVDGLIASVDDMARDEARTPSPYKMKLTRRTKNGRTRQIAIRYGAVPIRLPERDWPLWLVVVRGFGQKAFTALTNHPCDTEPALRRVVLAYGQRWSCEESFRFLKNQDHGFDLEDLRVLRYEPIRRLAFLALLAWGFIAEIAGGALAAALRTGVWCLTKSREVTTFLAYQVLRAASEILRRRGARARKRW